MLENSWVTSKLILAFLLTLSAYSNAESTRLHDTITSPEIITQPKETSGRASNNTHSQYRQEKSPPPVEHPSLGESTKFGNNVIKLTGKVQNYTGDSSRDPDILSPKSVNIHPAGNKFYVNSLENGKTVVYSLPELKKLAVINHRFNSSNSQLWAPASGLFKFRHYTEGLNNFVGKPVESAFSHEGRYLWVPYYRRSFDLNAQDPSALAVIDTSADTIVRVMEAGVLPKMVAVAPDGHTIAIAHWGDNTVGLINASSDDPSQWKYIANIAVGRQLFHDFSLTQPVDRDKDSGEALRGSVFTPNGRFLLIGCMSGGGIAVIDVKRKKYLGKLLGMMPNVRHVVINNDWLYTSVNVAGYVQRKQLSDVMDAVASMDDSPRNVTISGWQTVKVQPGARTLELSPAGDFIFVACNLGSCICIVDSSMRKTADLTVDSYPVGLDISPDGKWLISTSQGRKKFGGNCVDIFELTGLHSNPVSKNGISEDNIKNDLNASVSSLTHIFSFLTHISEWHLFITIAATTALLAGLLLILRHRKGNRTCERREARRGEK